MGIEKVIVELDGSTRRYRLIVCGDAATVHALREELVRRMLERGGRGEGGTPPERPRTKAEMAALAVARLHGTDGRLAETRRVTEELRRMGWAEASYGTSTHLRNAERMGLLSREGGGWVPAERSAAQRSEVAAPPGMAETGVEPDEGEKQNAVPEPHPELGGYR